jgi:putative transcriptional regulator
VSRQQADGRAGQDDEAAAAAPFIRVRLDELLSKRGMTLTELSARVDVTVVNLSILKNGRARAIRFSTLARLCEALDCQPGDLLSYEPPAAAAPRARAAAPPASRPATQPPRLRQGLALPPDPVDVRVGPQ